MNRAVIEDPKLIKKLEKEIAHLLTNAEMFQDEVIRHLVYKGLDRDQAKLMVEKVAADQEQNEGKYAWLYIIAGTLILIAVGVLMVFLTNEGAFEPKILLIAVFGALMIFKGVYDVIEK